MAALAGDNFNRANETPLAGNWAKVTGESGAAQLNLASNQVVSSDFTVDMAYSNSAVTWPADQYSQAAVTAVGTNTVGAGPGLLVRAASGARTYYRLAVDGAGTAAYEVGKFVGGTFTSLTTGTVARSAGQVLRLEAEGTAVRAKNNGVQFASTSDAAVASGQPGVCYSSSVTSAVWDDWEGGDFSVASLMSVAAPLRHESLRPAPFRPGFGR